MFWTKRCKICKAKVYPPYIYPSRVIFKKVPLCQQCFDKMEEDCDKFTRELSELLEQLKEETESYEVD